MRGQEARTPKQKCEHVLITWRMYTRAIIDIDESRTDLRG